MKVEEETSNNLLEMIIGLYIRVQCHSYAKDIKEKEKVKRKSIRKQSLRTEIKKKFFHCKKYLESVINLVNGLEAWGLKSCVTGGKI